MLSSIGKPPAELIMALSRSCSQSLMGMLLTLCGGGPSQGSRENVWRRASELGHFSAAGNAASARLRDEIKQLLTFCGMASMKSPLISASRRAVYVRHHHLLAINGTFSFVRDNARRAPGDEGRRYIVVAVEMPVESDEVISPHRIILRMLAWSRLQVARLVAMKQNRRRWRRCARATRAIFRARCDMSWHHSHKM